MEYRKIFTNIFKIMILGLLITFGTAYYVYTKDNMLYNIFETNLYYFIIVFELLLVIVLSALSHKLSFQLSILMFGLYSFVSGLTFAIIFSYFSIQSIMTVLLVTTFMFVLFVFLGDILKVDLTKYSTYIYVGLIVVCIATIANIFIGNNVLDIIISIIAILLFLGITMYDIQKIKKLSNMGIEPKKLYVTGALDLYLDFINIFIRLLSIFGKEK